VSLIREARGLPKFTLDCGFWQQPRYAGLSLAAIGLHVAGVSYAYRAELDGRLPGNPRRLAAALGLQLDEVDVALTELLDLDAWISDGDELVIAGFTDDHVSAAEVRARRERRAASSAKANHARWHRDAPDVSCPYCVPDSESESTTDPSAESTSDPSPNPPESPLHSTSTSGSGSGSTPRVLPMPEAEARKLCTKCDTEGIRLDAPDRHDLSAGCSHPDVVHDGGALS
jgi:hypothetical protein